MYKSILIFLSLLGLSGFANASGKKRIQCNLALLQNGKTETYTTLTPIPKTQVKAAIYNYSTAGVMVQLNAEGQKVTLRLTWSTSVDGPMNEQWVEVLDITAASLRSKTTFVGTEMDGKKDVGSIEVNCEAL